MSYGIPTKSSLPYFIDIFVEVSFALDMLMSFMEPYYDEEQSMQIIDL